MFNRNILLSSVESQTIFIKMKENLLSAKQGNYFEQYAFIQKEILNNLHLWGYETRTLHISFAPTVYPISCKRTQKDYDVKF